MNCERCGEELDDCGECPWCDNYQEEEYSDEEW